MIFFKKSCFFLIFVKKHYKNTANFSKNYLSERKMYFIELIRNNQNDMNSSNLDFILIRIFGLISKKGIIGNSGCIILSN